MRLNALVTCKRVLSKFKWDVAPVADGDCVFNGFLQRDMCDDMSMVACGVVCGDVDESFDTHRVPHSVWELHRSGPADRGVVPDRNGRPIEIPVGGGKGSRSLEALPLRGGEGDSRQLAVTRERGGGFGFSCRGCWDGMGGNFPARDPNMPVKKLRELSRSFGNFLLGSDRVAYVDYLLIVSGRK